VSNSSMEHSGGAPRLYLPPFKRAPRAVYPEAGARSDDEGSDSDKASVDTSAGSSHASTCRDDQSDRSLQWQDGVAWPWDLVSPGNWRVRNTFIHDPLNKFTLLQVFHRRRRASSVPAGGREAIEREEAAQPPALIMVGQDPWAADVAEAFSTPREVLSPQTKLAVPQEASEAVTPRVSEGSVAHDQGLCKPCAFFWKDIGCKSGAACQFCHLCEPDERKRRNREKRVVRPDAAASGPVLSPQALLELPSCEPAPQHDEEAAPRLLVSQGSTGHAKGKCKPCAFFGKGTGCNSAETCLFCHLCGSDARKRRSKEKKATSNHRSP